MNRGRTISSRGAWATRMLPGYAAVAVVATALFFCLHALGNRLPPELARERLTEADAGHLGYLSGIRDRWSLFEYCQIWSTTLSGALGAADGHALRDAVLLKVYRTSDYCDALQAVANGDALKARTLKTRYWWGAKALFAIALQYWSAADIWRLTEIATWAAFGLLAAALVALSARAFLAAAPLVVFGALFSGVPYFSGAANGLPFLWAALSGAVLALTLRFRPAAALLCCFVTGVGSSYLWLFDGHNFLIVALIGMMAWFGPGAADDREKLRRALSFAALYAAGFVVCYALGQVVKMTVEESFGGSAAHVSASIANQFLYHLNRMIDDFSPYPSIGHYYTMIFPGPGRLFSGTVMTATALSAFAIAVWLAWKEVGDGERRRRLRRDLLWIAGLTAVVWLKFVLPDDLSVRNGRYLFLPHALLWSGALVASTYMDRKGPVVLAGVFLAALSLSWFHGHEKRAALARQAAALADAVQPATTARAMMSGGTAAG